MRSPLRRINHYLPALALVMALGGCNEPSKAPEVKMDSTIDTSSPVDSEQPVEEELPNPEISIQIFNHQYVFKLL